MNAKVTKGFRLCVAPGRYVEGGEDDDAHLTNRGARGDSGAVDSAEIDDVAAFGARAGIDWEAETWPAITNALRETLIALCAGMVGDGDAVGDFSMAAHQSMRIPKIVEAAFLLDASSAPWLVDLCQPECSNPRAKTLHAAVEEAFAVTPEVFAEAQHERAMTLIHHGQNVGRRCDGLVEAIAHSAYDAATSAALVLGTRYYKRINAHIINILTSVVMPLHKLDYFDEDAIPAD